MVEWGRLLSGCWVCSSTGGSNPPLPAEKARAEGMGFFIRHSILSGRNRMIFCVATSTGLDWLKT